MLDIVYTGSGMLPMEPLERLQLYDGKSSKLLNNLNDLKDAVRINNPTQALNFDRLRTSSSTWYLWPGNPTIEIVDKQHVDKMANYGLKSLTNAKDSGGFMGVISQTQMRSLNITEASVKQYNHSFVIHRCLLEEKKRNRFKILKVVETITQEGGYSQRVIEQKLAPRKINWYIIRFE